MTDSATPARRFPPPWRVARTTGGWRIEDATGQPRAYVYGDDRPQAGSHVLTVDEARRIALGIARLPDLLAASTEGPRITEAPDQPETTQ